MLTVNLGNCSSLPGAYGVDLELPSTPGDVGMLVMESRGGVVGVREAGGSPGGDYVRVT